MKKHFKRILIGLVPALVIILFANLIVFGINNIDFDPKIILDGAVGILALYLLGLLIEITYIKYIKK